MGSDDLTSVLGLPEPLLSYAGPSLFPIAAFMSSSRSRRRGRHSPCERGRQQCRVDFRFDLAGPRRTWRAASLGVRFLLARALGGSAGWARGSGRASDRLRSVAPSSISRGAGVQVREAGGA